MLRRSPYAADISGLTGIRYDSCLNPQFVIAEAASSFAKEQVVLICSCSVSADMFRVACNKALMNMNSEKVRFINPTVVDFGAPISEILIKSLCEEGARLNGARCVVILDNLTLICGSEVEEKIKFVHNVLSTVSDDSTVVYTDPASKLPIDHDVFIDLTSVGSSFGKKVTGRLDLITQTESDPKPQFKSWHYCMGERSVQLFHPGNADVM
ncbi:unnamed protein product [Bursaphelenchus okinawaensis]|uniref:Uncharacterized protein n=1 Tax=Bursaphelenchus okinawaensis TaxID=465554 RepID=A0A811LQH2_9BILA|nr:unnamed protein product [Bursaphelenchus okinawaensis]CAG9126344.1 unnamed protein product [Bursaphelenchus okinawaensis]